MYTTRADSRPGLEKPRMWQADLGNHTQMMEKSNFCKNSGEDLGEELPVNQEHPFPIILYRVKQIRAIINLRACYSG